MINFETYDLLNMGMTFLATPNVLTITHPLYENELKCLGRGVLHIANLYDIFVYFIIYRWTVEYNNYYPEGS